MQKQQAVHTAGGQRWKFYFSPIKYAIPIPIRTIPIPTPIPICSPKLLPFPWESHGMGIPWESYRNPTVIPWEWKFPFPCTPLLLIATEAVSSTSHGLLTNADCETHINGSVTYHACLADPEHILRPGITAFNISVDPPTSTCGLTPQISCPLVCYDIVMLACSLEWILARI